MNEIPDRIFTRRHFICGVVPAGTMLCIHRAAAAESPPQHVAESDPLAKSLGYVEDAKHVDPKSNPTYKAGEHCANCLQLQGKAGDAWRPCTIFAGRLVSANGWCRVWVQNPKVT